VSGSSTFLALSMIACPRPYQVCANRVAYSAPGTRSARLCASRCVRKAGTHYNATNRYSQSALLSPMLREFSDTARLTVSVAPSSVKRKNVALTIRRAMSKLKSRSQELSEKAAALSHAQTCSFSAGRRTAPNSRLQLSYRIPAVDNLFVNPEIPVGYRPTRSHINDPYELQLPNLSGFKLAEETQPQLNFSYVVGNTLVNGSIISPVSVNVPVPLRSPLEIMAELRSIAGSERDGR
jgi:hypothetical protein